MVAEMSLNPLPSLMQEDLNTILNESQKKYSEIREVSIGYGTCEIRWQVAGSHHLVYSLYYAISFL